MRRFCFFVWLVLGVGVVAEGSAVTVEFSGTVGSTSFIVPPELKTVVAPGSPVQGRFVYDTEMIDSDPLTTRGLYVHRDPSTRLEVQLGNAYVATHPQEPEMWIQILNDHRLDIAPQGLDRFDVISRKHTPLYPSTVIPGQLHILLSDLTKTVFDSDSLPTQPPALHYFAPAGNPFGQGQVATLAGENPRVFIGFSIEQWQVVETRSDWQKAPRSRRRRGEIVWSEPLNGLVLGIENPMTPLLFVPLRGARDVPEANAVGGRWHSKAQLCVYLKNTTANPLSWSPDRRLWDIDMTAPFIEKGPHDMNMVTLPERWYRLGPGRMTEVLIPVTRAAPQWPLVPEGDYPVVVHYRPDRVKTHKRQEAAPLGSSDFWSGQHATPSLSMSVRHPQSRVRREKARAVQGQGIAAPETAP